jgi:alkylation response protein AidB-like acyl-CoA dehydrogenase
MNTGGGFLISTIGQNKVFCPESFSDTQREFANATEEFALNEILPKNLEIEKFDQQLSKELIRSCGELGLLGIDIPEEYGGLSADSVTSALIVEKITYGQSESFTVTFSVHTGIGTVPIVYFGTEEQRKKYLPKLASGEWLSAYALTEAGAGSDALSIKTSAKLSDDGKFYIITGNKQFISNGGWADILITFAKINGDKLTGFIIDPKSDGVNLQEEKNKLGLHGSSTCNIILENVKVPRENILGKVGKGADIAFNSLNIGRYKLGAAVLGGCKVTVAETVKYALERNQFGQPIAHFEAIKKKIADMVVRTYALESIVYETAHLLDQSMKNVNADSPTYWADIAHSIEKFALECSICKVYGSESHWYNVDDGIQIFGGYGFMEDYPLARVMRDTRVDRIYEGTNEINKQIILGYILKKTLLEELPVRERIKDIPGMVDGKIPSFADGPLVQEKKSTQLAKGLILFLFNEALTHYGQDIMNRQQVGELLSDMIIDAFLMDTTLDRIDQTSQNIQYPGLILNIGKVLIAEKIMELLKNAKVILFALLKEKALDDALKNLNKFENIMILKTNIFLSKEGIAEKTYQIKKYPF